MRYSLAANTDKFQTQVLRFCLHAMVTGFREVIAGLASSPDAVVQKYVARIQSKLQAAGAL